MEQIEPKNLNPNFNIIDIRDKEAYVKGHIYDAKNIVMNLLINMPERYLNKDDKYYIYCSSGYKSQKCCKLLNMIGYNVVNVIGGYEKYTKGQ